MSRRKIIAGISALLLAASSLSISFVSASAAETTDVIVSVTENTADDTDISADEEIDPEFTISEKEEKINEAKPEKPAKPPVHEHEKPEKPEPPKVNIDDIDIHHPDKDKIKEYTQIDFSEITNNTVLGSGYSQFTKDLGFNWNAALELSKVYDEEGVFTGFTGLIKFDVDINNADFTSIEGVLFDKAMKVLISYPDCREGTTFTIPEGVEEIAAFAFDNCKNLEKVKLPHTIKHIGPGAFKGSSIKEINIPGQVGKIEHHAFEGAAALEKVELGEGIKKIGPGAFKGCEKLKEVKLPDTVKVIEEEAFSGNESLEDINVPEKLENVKTGAFDDCTSVDELIKSAIEKYCELVYGDVNNDKVKDLSDLTDLALALLKDKNLSDIQSIAADVVDDDVIDIADVATLKQSILGEDLVLGPDDFF